MCYRSHPLPASKRKEKKVLSHENWLHWCKGACKTGILHNDEFLSCYIAIIGVKIHMRVFAKKWRTPAKAECVSRFTCVCVVDIRNECERADRTCSLGGRLAMVPLTMGCGLSQAILEGGAHFWDAIPTQCCLKFQGQMVFLYVEIGACWGSFL